MKVIPELKYSTYLLKLYCEPLERLICPHRREFARMLSKKILMPGREGRGGGGGVVEHYWK